jgi:ABC-type bacteriocin/lantibiotic exporter with double-glycine peptidase domain
LTIRPIDNIKTLETIKGDILINNLSYSYNDIDETFNSVNIKINENGRILIYGKSGIGKSTLVKILLKYIDNYSGNIHINGRNLKDINETIINNSFTYVSQNEKIFSDTIINNILLGRNISIKKLNKILNITNVDKIIDNKKFRRMHLIEENGFNLSGGERQKIILARGLIKDSNYLILDEALSEVGVDEEIEIIKNIFKKLKDKTIIYISHKQELLNLFENKYMFYQKGETC